MVGRVTNSASQASTAALMITVVSEFSPDVDTRG